MRQANPCDTRSGEPAGGSLPLARPGKEDLETLKRAASALNKMEKTRPEAAASGRVFMSVGFHGTVLGKRRKSSRAGAFGA